MTKAKLTLLFLLVIFATCRDNNEPLKSILAEDSFNGANLRHADVGSNCGGNCPAGNCGTCDCGTNKNFTDLETLCSGVSWDKNCCKCIILRISLGNTNYMVSNGTYGVVDRAGLAAFNYDECNYKANERCYPPVTKSCMFTIY